MNIFKKKMTLIAEVFPKLRSPKNKVRSMSIKSRFKGSFKKQHGKRAQTLLKFAWQHLYHIYWSLWRQLTCKKSVLLTCKIQTLFPNTLGANFFLHFWNQALILNIFQKKDDSHSWRISEITDLEKHGYISV